MTNAWEAPGLLPADEAKRVRDHRRLQSWYRHVQLGAPPGKFGSYDPLGSYLSPEAVHEQSDLNFLHPAAHEHAKERAVAVQQEGGSLEKQRLFHNMLSSMPMCFNLFGAMRAEHDSFLPVFRSLFDPDATQIVEIVCEWAPKDPAARIGDRTAFDAIVRYETGSERRFVGIETKYTEPFSSKNYPGKIYESVTEQSRWFSISPGAVERLRSSATHQLWRNVMLASQLEAHGSEGRGSVAVVAMSDDAGAAKAVDRVRAEMADTHQDRLLSIPIESILDTTDALAPELSWWATSFRRRYLDLSLPDSPHAAQDELGPRLSRTLIETAALARRKS